jgi:hypothetical protein
MYNVKEHGKVVWAGKNVTPPKKGMYSLNMRPRKKLRSA